MPVQNVLEFKITLRDIEPAIWRRVHVSDRSTMFDLHVAIQSAMGWKDHHLHVFRFPSLDRRSVEIGLPDLLREPGDWPRIPGWSVDAETAFTDFGSSAQYEYDFGDGWIHDVVLQKVIPREHGIKLPRCIDGARACPPEDCGGPPGYQLLLEILADARHAQHQEMILWLGRPFDPEAFAPENVRFMNAQRRLEHWRGLEGR